MHNPKNIFKCDVVSRRKKVCIITAAGILFSSVIILILAFVFGFSPKETAELIKARSMYEFNATDIDGNVTSLSKYRGFVLIITNVASKAINTKVNYSKFAMLHAKYAKSGLRILAFPSNEFGEQEPGNETQIKQFAKSYDAQYDMFSKIKVNGENAHPLWKWLMNQPKGCPDRVNWNFTKFLIDRQGQVVKRYGPFDALNEMEEDLLKYL